MKRTFSKLVATVTALAHVVAIAPVARAQGTCDTNCPIRSRDARGCCPSTSAPAPTPAPAPKSGPAPKSSGSKSSSCPGGQEVTPDTAGHCCWPGQAWAGARCVGIPSMCPSGYSVDKEKQACQLELCTSGKVRTADGVHCCWPGQAWSSRDVCVGVPSCPTGTEPQGENCVTDDTDGDGVKNSADKCPNEPEDKDGFEDADGCPDPDNDKDGILDAQDKCPNDPEDKNGFKDDDGCPDEAEKAALAAAGAAAKARVDAAREAQAAREKQEAEQKRAEEERQRAEKERLDEIESKERHRTMRRVLGYSLAGVGIAGELAMGFCLWQGSRTNSIIQDGGIAYGSEISKTAERGRTFNYGAIGFGVGGVVFLAVGIPLALLNQKTPAAAATKPGLTATVDGVKVRF